MGFSDAFFSLFSIVDKSTFDKPWKTNPINYQKLSIISFFAVCDFSQHSVVRETFNYEYHPNNCGIACLLLKDTFDGDYPKAFPSYSSTDHVHMVTLTSSKDIQTREYQNSNDEGEKLNVFMSFRGTFIWDLVNQRRNGNIGMVLVSLCMNCAVTGGPYKNFVALRSVVFKDLVLAEKQVLARRDNCPDSECPLPKDAIIGMSMGSQLAAFAAVYLKNVQSKPIAAFYSFGAPRSGNKAFSVFVRKINVVVLFAYYRDVVPHHPPRFFGYRTTAEKIYWNVLDPVYFAKEERGEHVHFKDYMSYKYFDGSGSGESFSNSISFFSIEDHNHYFVGTHEEALVSCGAMADYFMQNVKGTALFL